MARSSRRSRRSSSGDRAARCTTRRSRSTCPVGRYVVEQAPVVDADGRDRGVVAEGPVGTRGAGRFRVFRYEVRCWLGGEIPDLRAAIGSPVRLSDDGAVAQRVLDVVRTIPTPVWGRDELRTGEMWNSNSVISWTLTRSGIDLSSVQPPARWTRAGMARGCGRRRDAGARTARERSERSRFRPRGRPGSSCAREVVADGDEGRRHVADRPRSRDLQPLGVRPAGRVDRLALDHAHDGDARGRSRRRRRSGRCWCPGPGAR